MSGHETKIVRRWAVLGFAVANVLVLAHPRWSWSHCAAVVLLLIAASGTVGSIVFRLRASRSRV